MNFSSITIDNWIHSTIENCLGGKWTMPLFRKYFDAVLDAIFSDRVRLTSLRGNYGAA